MEYKANSGIWGTMFGVPCIVADNFLKLADGSQIKVLLYLLRFSGRNCTADEIALNTGIEKNEVQNAVVFWQKVNVLTPDSTPQNWNDTQTNESTPSETAKRPDDEHERSEEQSEAERSKPPKKPELMPSDISKIILENPDIKELCQLAETHLGPLNYTQQNSLIWIYSNLGLKKEVILVLVSYCATINKTYPNYIEKIACKWSDEGINTLELAEQTVNELSDSNDFYSRIKSIFNMARNLTSNEKETADYWRKCNFSFDLITYAYELTVENINKVSFKYTNSILERWKSRGVTSIAEAKTAKSARGNKGYRFDYSDGIDDDDDEYKKFGK